MSSKSTGQIRLANGADRTSILYNTYQLLTQTAALYANFAAYAGFGTQNIYDRLSEELIRDLGTLYTAWEGIDHSGRKAVPDGERLAAIVARSSQQIAKVTTHASEWTPLFRRYNLGILAEKRLSRIFTALMRDAGKEQATLAQLIERSAQRREELTQLLHLTKKDARKTQDAFSAADLSLLDKSFGF